ncbi:phage nozzle protein [Microbulbifer sp. 2201CG32-9]|uniref:phage nozzle protein n=1 Tax=Microbulbifer sp. 2201CG32-9 TaxID=3232309 RepID=UPI00345C2E99
MSLVSRHIPALFQGVSQQPATLRQPAQAERMVNCYATVADGLKKRPPFQHVAKVTTADISTAFVHTINRDVGERYVVVITDGDLKVYDANTGAEKTVNFPQGKAYLNVSGNANASFSLVSIADYTFVVNKEKKVRIKDTPITQPPNYSSWYRPNTWRALPASRTYSTYGRGTLTGTVNTFSDLPKASDPSPPSNGALYKVAGYDENNFGGYYVRRVGGVWEETYGPGANDTLDELTMPWALVRQSNGDFDLTTFGWDGRRFGDEETNPPPTFVGRTINDVFYWKNRLGFLTDENVVFSGAGDYGNFWRNTVTTLLDSDVVDVASTTTKVSLLEYAVPFNNGLMLFADQTQFSLNVTDLLTPTSVSIDVATNYEMDRGVRPIGIGTDVYFVTRSGPYSKMREYFVSEDSLSNDAADVTAHAPRYLPRNLFKIAGNGNEDVIFGISSEPGHKNHIYAYKFYWSGDQKLQSAWGHWELDPNDRLLSIDVIENNLYALIRRTDGTYLERCDLDDSATVAGLDFDILLDRRYEVRPGDMRFEAGNNRTVITLPWNTGNCDRDSMRVVYTTGSDSVGRLAQTDTYTYPISAGNAEIAIPGDVRSFKPVVGLGYDSEYQFSEQFMVDRKEQAITTGRLQLRTFTVYYQDAGYFETEVQPYGELYSSVETSIVPSGLSSFTGRTVGEESLQLGSVSFHSGAYTFDVSGNSKEAVVILKNPSHLQAKFSSCEWEALWHNRSRSMG